MKASLLTVLVYMPLKISAMNLLTSKADSSQLIPLLINSLFCFFFFLFSFLFTVQAEQQRLMGPTAYEARENPDHLFKVLVFQSLNDYKNTQCWW